MFPPSQEREDNYQRDREAHLQGGEEQDRPADPGQDLGLRGGDGPPEGNGLALLPDLLEEPGVLDGGDLVLGQVEGGRCGGPGGLRPGCGQARQPGTEPGEQARVTDVLRHG
ncbi:MAG TPA: hypothetical protein PLA39_07680 [Methanoculleus sp.]|nr:hypothetical protein [Methanoculleus sp.]